MQPLAAASLVERVADGVRFALDNGWECRLFVLSADLMRVLLIPPGGLREPRTWMVATRGSDVPCADRPSLQPLALRDRSRPERRRLRALLRHTLQRNLRSRLRARQLPRLVPLLRDRSRGPRLLHLRRPEDSRRCGQVCRADRPHGLRPALELGLRQYGHGAYGRRGRAAT